MNNFDGELAGALQQQIMADDPLGDLLGNLEEGDAENVGDDPPLESPKQEEEDEDSEPLLTPKGVEMKGFSCMVCYDPFNTKTRIPKVFPCGHTFCVGCVKGLMTSRGGFLSSSNVSCPTCRQNTRIPVSTDPAKVPTNFSLLSMLEQRNEEMVGQERDRDVSECFECHYFFGGVELTLCNSELCQPGVEGDQLKVVDSIKRPKVLLVCQKCIKAKHSRHNFVPFEKVVAQYEANKKIIGAEEVLRKGLTRADDVLLQLGHITKEIMEHRRRMVNAMENIRQEAHHPYIYEYLNRFSTQVESSGDLFRHMINELKRFENTSKNRYYRSFGIDMLRPLGKLPEKGTAQVKKEPTVRSVADAMRADLQAARNAAENARNREVAFGGPVRLEDLDNFMEAMARRRNIPFLNDGAPRVQAAVPVVPVAGPPAPVDQQNNAGNNVQAVARFPDINDFVPHFQPRQVIPGRGGRNVFIGVAPVGGEQIVRNIANILGDANAPNNVAAEFLPPPPEAPGAANNRGVAPIGIIGAVPAAAPAAVPAAVPAGDAAPAAGPVGAPAPDAVPDGDPAPAAVPAGAPAPAAVPAGVLAPAPVVAAVQEINAVVGDEMMEEVRAVADAVAGALEGIGGRIAGDGVRPRNRVNVFVRGHDWPALGRRGRRIDRRAARQVGVELQAAMVANPIMGEFPVIQQAVDALLDNRDAFDPFDDDFPAFPLPPFPRPARRRRDQNRDQLRDLFVDPFRDFPRPDPVRDAARPEGPEALDEEIRRIRAQIGHLDELLRGFDIPGFRRVRAAAAAAAEVVAAPPVQHQAPEPWVDLIVDNPLPQNDLPLNHPDREFAMRAEVEILVNHLMNMVRNEAHAEAFAAGIQVPDHIEMPPLLNPEAAPEVPDFNNLLPQQVEPYLIALRGLELRLIDQARHRRARDAQQQQDPEQAAVQAEVPVVIAQEALQDIPMEQNPVENDYAEQNFRRPENANEGEPVVKRNRQ